MSTTYSISSLKGLVQTLIRPPLISPPYNSEKKPLVHKEGRLHIEKPLDLSTQKSLSMSCLPLHFRPKMAAMPAARDDEGFVIYPHRVCAEEEEAWKL